MDQEQTKPLIKLVSSNLALHLANMNMCRSTLFSLDCLVNPESHRFPGSFMTMKQPNEKIEKLRIEYYEIVSKRKYILDLSHQVKRILRSNNGLNRKSPDSFLMGKVNLFNRTTRIEALECQTFCNKVESLMISLIDQAESEKKANDD